MQIYALTTGSAVFVADEGEGKKGKGPSKALLQFVKEEGDTRVNSPKRKGSKVKLKTVMNYAFDKDEDPQVQKAAKQIFQKLFKPWLKKYKDDQAKNKKSKPSEEKEQAKAKKTRYEDSTAKSPKLFSKRINKFLNSSSVFNKKRGARITKKFFNQNLRKLFKESGGTVHHTKLKKELGISGEQYKITMQALADAGIATKAGKGKWTLMGKRDKAYDDKRKGKTPKKAPAKKPANSKKDHEKKRVGLNREIAKAKKMMNSGNKSDYSKYKTRMKDAQRRLKELGTKSAALKTGSTITLAVYHKAIEPRSKPKTWGSWDEDRKAAWEKKEKTRQKKAKQNALEAKKKAKNPKGLKRRSTH